MAAINLFPTLTNNLINQSVSELDRYKFFHDSAAVTTRGRINKKELVLEDYSSDDELVIQDINNSWDVNYDNLYIETNLEIEKPFEFFGSKGIAPENAVLGVAIRWYSRESKQRGVEKSFLIDSKDRSINKKIQLKFDESQLREVLNIEVILYISKVATEIATDELQLANQSGIILGVLDSVRLVLEGESSTFPIQTIKGGDGPLWDLHIGWGDLYDNFNDSVWLRINEDHKDYKYLEVKNNAFSQPLLNEIMISTVAILIQTVKDTGELNSLFEEDSFAFGTVGFLIKYYIDVYQVNFETPTNIFSTVGKGLRG